MVLYITFDEKMKTKKFQERKVDFLGRNVEEMMAMFWPWPFFLCCEGEECDLFLYSYT